MIATDELRKLLAEAEAEFRHFLFRASDDFLLDGICLNATPEQSANELIALEEVGAVNVYNILVRLIKTDRIAMLKELIRRREVAEKLNAQVKS